MTEYGVSYVETLLVLWLVLRVLRRKMRWGWRLRERRKYQSWQMWVLRPRNVQEVGS